MTKKTKNSNETQSPKKMGRPSIFSDTVAKKVIELAGQGKTDEQIADIIGVTSQTLRNWRKSNENFLWAIKEAKQMADELVEASLFKRALGYDVYEEKGTKDGTFGSTRHIPADATSMIFWLKNRKPKEWRDKVDIEQDSTHTFILDTGNGVREYPS